ncbi:hypothetical protein GRF29_213g1160603 [Pseudopithomyces chartarum]|uniref:NADP-dependent oxidoreductase domain-containing protein n=1 Tax=Pseudopithomyces chartarum TaxID=1892770 RepID=A0AAN6LN65_9PLEO|nr:hypothetical protein GRF29_213g1160603 [Pseudopithomyces chartarum]
MAPIKVIFGAASFPHSFSTIESQTAVLSALQSAGVTTLDTARLYPGSEAAIGPLPDRTSFTIDTKVKGGFAPGTATRAAVLSDIKDSLDKLKVPKVDVLYIHAPDASIPFEDTLAGINDAYKEGLFERFGISNFTAEQVQEVWDITGEKGWVKPSVYQGNYSPVARHLETLLFPTLRRLGLSFYAYSPLAGGFLTKSVADLDGGKGRFAAGGLYAKLYDNKGLRDGLEAWGKVAEEEGVSKAELAYRWVGYNSQLKSELGDAVLFGASRLEQVGETAGWLAKGG